MTTKQGHTISVVMLWFYRGGTMLGIYLAGMQLHALVAGVENVRTEIQTVRLQNAVLGERVEGHERTLVIYDRRFDRLEHPTQTD